jgi:prevent-host-death family protein
MASYATVKELRTSTAEILGRLQGKKDRVVITKRGHPVALLLPVSEDEVDVLPDMIERVKLQLAVREIRTQAKARGLDRLSVEEIDALIRKTRTQEEDQSST